MTDKEISILKAKHKNNRRCESCQCDLEDLGFDVPLDIILSWGEDTMCEVEDFAHNLLYGKADCKAPSALSGYEHISILDECINILAQEIKWCGSDEAKEVDKSQDFKDGFLAGINQAILFAEKLKMMKDE